MWASVMRISGISCEENVRRCGSNELGTLLILCQKNEIASAWVPTAEWWNSWGELLPSSPHNTSVVMNQQAWAEQRMEDFSYFYN